MFRRVGQHLNDLKTGDLSRHSYSIRRQFLEVLAILKL